MLLLTDPSGGTSSDELEQQIRMRLNQASDLAPFTIMLEAPSGHRLVHSVGEYRPDTETESASTSKLVTATVVLWYAERKLINLQDTPQTYLPYWPSNGNLAEITLSQLLSFTSGLNNAPDCINNPFTQFAECVEQIPGLNPSPREPGTQFYYGSAHMQVAGAMLITALGVEDWHAVFNRFKSETQLFQTSRYAKPSTANPRLAGGMIWTAEEYLAFLKALSGGQVLNQNSTSLLLTDRLTNAEIVNSPSRSSYQEDWHYGYGVWLECVAQTFNCLAPYRYSSPGAWGAYPFWDTEYNYLGILARESKLPGASRDSVLLFRDIANLVAEWSSLNQTVTASESD
ncbi:hypothetical protein GCM10008090_20450 [Arenicella chitinivorans]|uniref:Beta-lactamase-related domain-containing protein n=2 Tax=Arenicella chitinivorans TaxID=1329800 RepID=A0A918VNQ9_9GAMM|nr:hypothetical protein GCM10008090_20450 [Arenicella chitinivorans]